MLLVQQPHLNLQQNDDIYSYCQKNTVINWQECLRLQMPMNCKTKWDQKYLGYLGWAPSPRHRLQRELLYATEMPGFWSNFEIWWAPVHLTPIEPNLPCESDGILFVAKFHLDQYSSIRLLKTLSNATYIPLRGEKQLKYRKFNQILNFWRLITHPFAH